LEHLYIITLTLEPCDVATTAASGRLDVIYTISAIQRVWFKAGPYRAGIFWDFKTPLVEVKGTGPRKGFTKVDYIKQVLEPIILSMLDKIHTELGIYPRLMEDGNNAHSLRGKNIVKD
jgi:hypothetical protein